ncbi:MAG: aspartate/glutamate racemase family protein [Acidobacteriota bacterium]
MGMRIAVIVVFAGKEGDPGFKLVASAYQRNFALVKNPDTEVDVFFLRNGLTTFEEFGYRHQMFLNDREMYHAILEAEKSGYDAVVPMCFFDPVLEEARKAVEIPVVAQGETELFYASMMGGRFGVITINEEAVSLTDDLIEKYGYRHRAVRTRSIGIPGAAQLIAAVDASHDIEAFTQVARESIKDGAQVLVPGCSGISMALRLAAGCEDKYPDGVTEIDGVAILDGMSVVVKTAEALVALKRGGSSFISRVGRYSRPPREVDEMTLAKFPYRGSGVWKA